MVRVKIWKPKLKREKKGKKTVVTIVEKRYELLSERSVMDRTLTQAEEGGDDFIINTKTFIEEDKEWTPPAEDEVKEKELDETSKVPEESKETKSVGQRISEFLGLGGDDKKDVFTEEDLNQYDEDKLLDIADELEVENVPESKEELVAAILEKQEEGK